MEMEQFGASMEIVTKAWNFIIQDSSSSKTNISIEEALKNLLKTEEMKVFTKAVARKTKEYLGIYGMYQAVKAIIQGVFNTVCGLPWKQILATIVLVIIVIVCVLALIGLLVLAWEPVLGIVTMAYQYFITLWS